MYTSSWDISHAQILTNTSGPVCTCTHSHAHIQYTRQKGKRITVYNCNLPPLLLQNTNFVQWSRFGLNIGGGAQNVGYVCSRYFVKRLQPSVLGRYHHNSLRVQGRVSGCLLVSKSQINSSSVNNRIHFLKYAVVVAFVTLPSLILWLMIAYALICCFSSLWPGS